MGSTGECANKQWVLDRNTKEARFNANSNMLISVLEHNAVSSFSGILFLVYMNLE